MTTNTVPHGSKLFLIGIDGATFDIIRPLLNKNKLPNMANLMKEGTYGKLRSTIPLTSPVAWTSLMTGKNPGKHGIFDFLSKDPGAYTMKFSNASYRKANPIWKSLSDAGKTVGVVNATISYPPDQVRGFMLSGLDTPSIDSVFSSPPELGRALQEKFGRYIFVNPHPFREGVEKFIRGIHKEIDYRFQTLSYLMDEYPWDFLTVTFIAVDGASHFLWRYRDPQHPDYNKADAEKYGNAIDEVYERLDETVGKLLDKIDDTTTVMIVSDHGFGPVYKAVHLNNWLKKHGYLKWNDSQRAGVVDDFKRRMKSPIQRMLPRKIRMQRRRTKLRELRKSSSAGALQAVKWSETKAFFNGTVGNIFLNVKGREPFGIVNPGVEVEEICDAIMNDLRNLKNPTTGENIVENIYTKKDTFKGSHMETAPELMVQFKRGYSAFTDIGNMELNKNIGDNVIIDSYKWSGDHELYGILMMKGPHIKKDHELNGAHVTDIVPTILHLQGMPVPMDMDGGVLEEALNSSFTTAHPVKYGEVEKSEEDSEQGEGYSEEDAEKVKKMLQGLGYLD